MERRKTRGKWKGKNHFAGAHYRRNLFRVKDVHISAQVKIDTEMGGTTDGKTTLHANWRF